MNLVLSLASAVLLVLSFPRFSLTWLAPVALAPILVACARELSWKRRFLNGWAAGIVFWFCVCFWIQAVLAVHGGLGGWLSWVTFILFAVLKGLHMGLFAALAGFLICSRHSVGQVSGLRHLAARGRSMWAGKIGYRHEFPPRPVSPFEGVADGGNSVQSPFFRGALTLPAVAALWTGLERTHGNFGFAWLDLGNAGIDMPVALRVAPFVGVYGLSFVFAMLGCAIALIALRRPRLQLVWVVPLLALPLLPALPGPAQAAKSGSADIRVVQPNVDTEADFTPESLADLKKQMAVLSHAPGVDLIVWPEWPAPFELSPSFRAFIGSIARDSHAPLIFNGVGRSTAGEPLNAAFLVNRDGAIVDSYDQINLVPFGEYVPAPFGWVNRITKETSDFVPGNRVVVFSAGDHRIGTFICYESAFPDLVRQFAQDGAEMLINISNDGYFAHSAAREQHLALARMRAAENRRWVLFSTNDGITATINPVGRVTEQLQPYRQLATDMHAQYLVGTTFYTRHGDWFAWGCLAVSIFLSLITARIALL